MSHGCDFGGGFCLSARDLHTGPVLSDPDSVTICKDRMASKVWSWAQIGALVEKHGQSTRLFNARLVRGPAAAQSRLRLFDADSEQCVRVTLFRDFHAWCPYCQKVWLWLEAKRVPYRVSKVTMFCYGEKESWYKKKVANGMLPALELDGQIITESDTILEALEEAFGPLAASMSDPSVVPLRRLERVLFRAWCEWLCYPARSRADEERAQAQFERVAAAVDDTLAQTTGPFFLPKFSTADVVFVPYVERMNASLFYYKGFLLRDPKTYPAIAAWFDGLEAREDYRGTQSDVHTHAHDLPPQMGGCYTTSLPGAARASQRECQHKVDHGPWTSLPDAAFPEPADSRVMALARCYEHREHIVAANPEPPRVADVALRHALATLMTTRVEGDAAEGSLGSTLPVGADVALRYIRDRINVPRDMPIWSARRLRAALEETAATVGRGQGPDVPVRHRRDQDPVAFGNGGPTGMFDASRADGLSGAAGAAGADAHSEGKEAASKSSM